MKSLFYVAWLKCEGSGWSHTTLDLRRVEECWKCHPSAVSDSFLLCKEIAKFHDHLSTHLFSCTGWSYLIRVYKQSSLKTLYSVSSFYIPTWSAREGTWQFKPSSPMLPPSGSLILSEHFRSCKDKSDLQDSEIGIDGEASTLPVTAPMSGVEWFPWAVRKGLL